MSTVFPDSEDRVPRFRGLSRRRRILRCSLFMLGLAAHVCSGCVTCHEWAIVETGLLDGVRVHLEEGCAYVVGGDPRFAHYWAHGGLPPWRLEPLVVGPKWPHVVGGSLSRAGFLAVARLDSGIEIFEFTTGRKVATILGKPLAIAWSNNGEILAYLEESAAWSGDPARLSLTLRSSWKEVIGRWDVPFDPPSDPAYCDRFALSWNDDDSAVVASTRASPSSKMPARCALVSRTNGRLCTHPGSDAYFVGHDLLLLTNNGRPGHIWLMRYTDDRLEKVRRIPGGWSVAASDSVSGLFVTWQSAPWWELKIQYLPVDFHDLEGDIPCRARTEFSSAATLQLIHRGDLPGYGHLTSAPH
jgi:hypothetical protein